MFANLFATRRELKRLAESEKYWRDKATALEGEKDRLHKLVLERDFAFCDRFLTAQVKTYPIDAEVKAKLGENPADSVENQAALTSFLLDRKLEFEQDAMAAGVDVEQAHRDYQRAEASLIKEFQDTNSFGFNN